MSRTKADQAAAIALEAIHDAAPGVLTMTQVAEKVAENGGVTTSTARNWLRAAVAAGDLLELTPRSRKFFIDLPGADDAGLGPFFIARRWNGSSWGFEITTDDNRERPSGYGPGKTTYLADPKQIREYVQKLADEKKAKEDAEDRARKDDEEAQRKEIARRFPGMSRVLRKVRFLGQNTRAGIGRAELMETEIRLSRIHGKEGQDITERRVHLDVMAWGDTNAALLQQILEAGIRAYIASQSPSECKYCARQILYTGFDRNNFWWHVDTSNATCGKDTDTKAGPAEEAETKD